MVRNGGTAVQVSGIDERITVDMRLFEWDKTYVNPLYGKCRPSRDFPRLFDLYAKGDLLLDELVTTVYTLDDAARAFDDLLAGRNAKGVISMEAL
jgi:S-(hydroxymethyl)glutathione dehydrogenase / alcohol dehydrogenase